MSWLTPGYYFYETTIKVSHNKVSLESRPYLTSGLVWLNWTQIYCSPGPILFSPGQTNTDIGKTLELDYWTRGAGNEWSVFLVSGRLSLIVITLPSGSYLSDHSGKHEGPSCVTPCVCPMFTVRTQCLCQMIQDINICAAIRNQNWPGCINDN